MIYRPLRMLGLLFAGLLMLGCDENDGPKTTRVHGKVTFAGKPLDDGTIEFTAADGSHAAQGQIREGTYDIPETAGPIVDRPYRVSIVSLAKTGKSRPNMMPGGGDEMDEYKNIIPARYNSQTTLNVTPTEQNGEFDFDLKK
jgi:hypothetical protein